MGGLEDQDRLDDEEKTGGVEELGFGRVRFVRPSEGEDGEEREKRTAEAGDTYRMEGEQDDVGGEHAGPDGPGQLFLRHVRVWVVR